LVFDGFGQCLKTGQSGGLNTKTCHLAGLGRRKSPLPGSFNPFLAIFVSVEGLEPSTNSLKGYCSAIELHARTFGEVR
jgi:hypothetical protein